MPPYTAPRWWGLAHFAHARMRGRCGLPRGAKKMAGCGLTHLERLGSPAGAGGARVARTRAAKGRKFLSKPAGTMQVRSREPRHADPLKGTCPRRCSNPASGYKMLSARRRRDAEHHHLSHPPPTRRRLSFSHTLSARRHLGRHAQGRLHHHRAIPARRRRLRRLRRSRRAQRSANLPGRIVRAAGDAGRRRPVRRSPTPSGGGCAHRRRRLDHVEHDGGESARRRLEHAGRRQPALSSPTSATRAGFASTCARQLRPRCRSRTQAHAREAPPQ